MRIGWIDLPGTTSCREVFRFLPGWPFQNLLLSPALEDNSDGGVTWPPVIPPTHSTPSFSWASALHGSGLRGHFDP